MAHEFDAGYWERHWRQGEDGGPRSASSPNPHLVRETAELVPGSALEAGCGAGSEAVWLAERGWQVTAADVSAEALAHAAGRASAAGVAGRVRWVQADLTIWQPEAAFDLVTTHYAHPAMPQLDFYDRIAGWVAPGGTLLVVGHLHGQGVSDSEEAHGHRPPAEASVTAASVTARLDDASWEVVTAVEQQRTVAGPGARAVQLHDVVVRARRLH